MDLENEPKRKSIAQTLYDNLSYIFLLCLPSDPLNQRQRDVTQPPMLLCHICADWRTIALSTPLLWTSLYHLPVEKHMRRAIVDQNDIEFLRWWQANVGLLNPSLRLISTAISGLDIENLVDEDDTRSSEFVIQFIASV